MTRIMDARWDEGDHERAYAIPVTEEDVDLSIRAVIHGIKKHHPECNLADVRWTTREDEHVCAT